jgi:hypothetical protein
MALLSGKALGTLNPSISIVILAGMRLLPDACSAVRGF